MEIKNLLMIPATGKQDNQFVGIKISKNQIEFHYPESFQLSEGTDGLRKDILTVLRSVSLAKTKTSDLSSYNSIYSKNCVFPLGAYLWLINDYLTYRHYVNRERFFVRGVKGKINWKRTMRSNPIISSRNIIYTDIISEKKAQKENLITEIYNYCIQKAVDAIGWLYGIVFDSDGVDYYKLFNKEKYLTALSTELSHTFDDQKKIRLQNMQNVISGLDDDMVNTRDMIYGVDSYDYVYERMVDSMFSKVDDIRSFYPNATWDLVIEHGIINSSNLRPDTVLIKDNKVYILDAKYYRYGTTFRTGDMPETTSIQKQITYGEYVKKVKSGIYDDVFSAFVLPYCKTNNIYKSRFNLDLEFVGIAKATWLDSDDVNSRNIVAILLDTRFLLSNWAKKNEDNINNIIQLIESNVGGVTRE